MKKTHPTSYQKNIMNMEHVYPDSAISNIGGLIDYYSHITYKEMFDIMSFLIMNTPALRIRLDKTGALYVCDDDVFKMKHIIMGGNKADALKQADKLMATPFKSIYGSPLYEAYFINYSDGQMCMLKAHHLIYDSRSFALFTSAVDMCLKEKKAGKDYSYKYIPAVYPNAETYKNSRFETYFESKINGYSGVSLFDKKCTNPSAEKMTFTMPLWKKNMTDYFLMALGIYMSNILNVSKISIGFVLANRSNEQMDMMGMFANTLPLIIDVKDDLTALRRQIKKDLISLIRFRGYPLEDIRKNYPSVLNLFDVSLTYRTGEYLSKVDIGEVYECFNGCSDVPVRIFADEAGDELKFSIIWQTELCNKTYINNMGECLISVIKQLQYPDEALSSADNIDIRSDYDKDCYKKLNSTSKYIRNKDLTELMIKHMPEDTIIKCIQISMGLEQDHYNRVGIYMERCPEMILAMTGCFIAEIPFLVLPYNDIYPDNITNNSFSDHIEIIKKNTGLDYIVTKENICQYMSDPNKKIRAEEENISYIKNKKYSPDSTAYMIRTSGTTGNPKCVEISRYSLLTRLVWADNTYGLNGRILQKTVNTFDVSIWEVFSVAFGADLYLLPSGEEKYPDKIAKALNVNKIEKVHFVPSFLSMFLGYVKRENITFPHLKEVYVSGEKLERSLAQRFFNIIPGVRLINYYGPAECSIDVTSYECSRDDLPDDIPIGKPADNTQICIINDKNMLLPVDITGEICIMGNLVGKGYTDGKTVTDTGGFITVNGKRAYKTGDMGKIGHDGNIYIYGRKDNEIKIRGIRINMSDIRNVLLSCSGIEDIHIIKKDNRLVCFYKANNSFDTHKKSIELRESLTGTLPGYMIPSVFLPVTEFPVNSSGKTDIVTLTGIYENYMKRGKNTQKNQQPNTSLTAKILTEVSKYINVSIDDDLFYHGLDSLTTIEIVEHLREQGIDIDYSDFYENLTIRQIAANLFKKHYYTFLKKTGYDRVVICFPYASGEPQNYTGLAKYLHADVIGIYTSAFSHNTTQDKMAEMLIHILPIDKYKEVYVYGQCIGCMNAFSFASKYAAGIAGMILVAPSLNSEVKPSVWKHVPDRVITGILRLAGSNDFESSGNNVIRKFRKDTDIYFKSSLFSMPNIHPRKGTVTIFGDRDIFTLNQKNIINLIKKQCKGIHRSYHVKNGKHFLNITNPRELARFINHSYRL